MVMSPGSGREPHQVVTLGTVVLSGGKHTRVSAAYHPDVELLMKNTEELSSSLNKSVLENNLTSNEPLISITAVTGWP